MSGIIVGCDGSSHAQVALEWAMREASIHDEPLIVLVVEQIAATGLQGMLVFPTDDTFLIDARISAREAVAKAAAQLGGRVPPSVTVRAIFGMPAAALIEASRDADLLVVGSRGVGSFNRQSELTAIPVPRAMGRNISVRMAGVSMPELGSAGRGDGHHGAFRVLRDLHADRSHEKPGEPPPPRQAGQPTCVPLSRFAGTCWLFLSAVKSCRASLWFHSTASPALAVS